jgi:N6-adenosine-specific RNA methylase IME4
MGMGVCWRPAHEICVFCQRGGLSANADESIPTVFDGKQPYMKSGRSVAKMHSGKPDSFCDLVERASPGPYLEMFARRARFGWDYYGDESLQTAQVPAA